MQQPDSFPRAVSLQPARGKDLLQVARGYRTPGCFTSPGLYGKWLNRSKGIRPVLLASKPLHNIGEVTLTRASGVRWGNSACPSRD